VVANSNKERTMTRLLASAIVMLLHITPTVVLVRREEAVRRLLPAATDFTAQEIRLSGTDSRRLREVTRWRPDDGILTFYAGTKDGVGVGALTFIRVDTRHGPIEVAVALGRDGAVRGVIVTKVTVETKPWMLEALRAGLTDQYTGLRPNDTVTGAAAIKGKVGTLPAYLAGEVDTGVGRAVAAYRLFYRPSS
jgi:hypothetical protein